VSTLRLEHKTRNYAAAATILTVCYGDWEVASLFRFLVLGNLYDLRDASVRPAGFASSLSRSLL